eukprot:292322-Chlamydomonas_euryale.AAC.3
MAARTSRARVVMHVTPPRRLQPAACAPAIPVSYFPTLTATRTHRACARPLASPSYSRGLTRTSPRQKRLKPRCSKDERWGSAWSCQFAMRHGPCADEQLHGAAPGIGCTINNFSMWFAC